jgi:hypothetical protein
VLFVAGTLIEGDPGTKNGAKIADHFADHRTAILIGMYLAGLGLLAFFVWVWSLRTILSRAGEEALAAAVLVAGALVIAVEFPVIALETGLAFISNERVDPGLARALHDLAQVFVEKLRRSVGTGDFGAFISTCRVGSVLVGMEPFMELSRSRRGRQSARVGMNIRDSLGRIRFDLLALVRAQMLHRPESDLPERWDERAAAVRQRVGHRDRRSVVDGAGDESGGREVGEPVGEHGVRDAADRA